MNDAGKFLQMMKQAAVDAYNAMLPCDIKYGKVINNNPIMVLFEGKTISGNLVTVLESAGELNTGDGVVMIRKTGGQKYIILGRAVA